MDQAEYETGMERLRQREEQRRRQPQSQESTTTNPNPDLKELVWVKCAGCPAEVGKVFDDGLCWDCHERADLAKEAHRIALERTKTALKRLREQVGEADYAKFTWERFESTFQNRKAWDAARAFNPDTSNLYLWGSNGSGKSHLGVCVARDWVEKGKVGEFWLAKRLVRNFMALNLKSEQYDAEMDRICGLDVLVIEELGRGADSVKSLEILFEIFDGRKRTGKNGLICLSNASPDELQVKFGDRTISERIVELMPMGSIIELSESVSWRLKNRKGAA